MCLPTVALVGIGLGVQAATTAYSTIGAVRAAEAQNRANDMARFSATLNAIEQMKSLAAREREASDAASQRKDLLSRAAEREASTFRVAVGEAGTEGATSSRYLRDIRRARLEGITAIDRNLASIRTQTDADAAGVNAQRTSIYNSLSDSDPTAIAIGGGLNLFGDITSGLLTPINKKGTTFAEDLRRRVFH